MKFYGCLSWCARRIPGRGLGRARATRDKRARGPHARRRGDGAAEKTRCQRKDPDLANKGPDLVNAEWIDVCGDVPSLPDREIVHLRPKLTGW
ncbi:hypothetical protein GCM10010435_56460 [Winogradskya consettensis]|uniref:Uncharacterized protein n=1 Tax=Winogradskya consettensis TaxID=113560 RepID=A0A919S890_9ACTN|nr:hypothetical protein Aco04nite_05860 [Actinoplanes consettensis]